MHSSGSNKEMTSDRRNCLPSAIKTAILILLVAVLPARPVWAQSAPPIKLAVFDFVLEDVSAAGVSPTGTTPGDPGRMQTVSTEARRVLAESGRYRLVDTRSAEADATTTPRALNNCDGCDAGIALKLGAEQSLVGVITRVAKTEYYVSLRITDTRTGKVVNEQSAFFTGAEDAWASGARVLIKHGVLTDAS